MYKIYIYCYKLLISLCCIDFGNTFYIIIKKKSFYVFLDFLFDLAVIKQYLFSLQMLEFLHTILLPISFTMALWSDTMLVSENFCK